MIGFTELLTASDADLVKIFYKVKVEPSDDFIKRINKIAVKLDLNHSQLVCALGFNKNIRDSDRTNSSPTGKTSCSLQIHTSNFPLIIFWISILPGLKMKK